MLCRLPLFSLCCKLMGIQYSFLLLCEPLWTYIIVVFAHTIPLLTLLWLAFNASLLLLLSRLSSHIACHVNFVIPALNKKLFFHIELHNDTTYICFSMRQQPEISGLAASAALPAYPHSQGVFLLPNTFHLF